MSRAEGVARRSANEPPAQLFCLTGGGGRAAGLRSSNKKILLETAGESRRISLGSSFPRRNIGRTNSPAPRKRSDDNAPRFGRRDNRLNRRDAAQRATDAFSRSRAHPRTGARRRRCRSRSRKRRLETRSMRRRRSARLCKVCLDPARPTAWRAALVDPDLTTPLPCSLVCARSGGGRRERPRRLERRRPARGRRARAPPRLRPCATRSRPRATTTTTMTKSSQTPATAARRLAAAAAQPRLALLVSCICVFRRSSCAKGFVCARGFVVVASAARRLGSAAAAQLGAAHSARLGSVRQHSSRCGVDGDDAGGGGGTPALGLGGADRGPHLGPSPYSQRRGRCGAYHPAAPDPRWLPPG